MDGKESNTVKFWGEREKRLMDWTTPLKFQQADFVKRLKQDRSNLLHCETQGLHSEVVTVSDGWLKKIRVTCRKKVLHCEQSAPVGEIFRDRLRHQLGVEAIAHCVEGLTPQVDPRSALTSHLNDSLTLQENPQIKVQVAAIGGGCDRLEWILEREKMKNHAAVALIWIPETIVETREEYPVILAGFLPTEAIAGEEHRICVTLDGLLYAGGLAAYVESQKTQVSASQWLQILKGASSYVYPVGISADGQTIASGSYDGTIKLWKLRDGELTRALGGHSWSFYPQAAGSGGQPLASGSTERTLNEWHKGSGEFIRTLTGHTSGVSAIAISEDGELLVSGGYDGSINIWNLDRGERIQSIAAHAGTIRPIAIGPQREFLVSGGIDKQLKLWDIQTGELIRSFPMNRDAVISLAISPNGEMLVSGSQDGMVKIWDLRQGNLVRAIAAHSGVVRAVAMSEDGKTLASGSMEKTIKLWDIDSGDLQKTLTGHADPTLVFAVKPEGPTLNLSVFRHHQPGWENNFGVETSTE